MYSWPPVRRWHNFIWINEDISRWPGLSWFLENGKWPPPTPRFIIAKPQISFMQCRGLGAPLGKKGGTFLMQNIQILYKYLINVLLFRLDFLKFNLI